MSKRRCGGVECRVGLSLERRIPRPIEGAGFDDHQVLFRVDVDELEIDPFRRVRAVRKSPPLISVAERGDFAEHARPNLRTLWCRRLLDPLRPDDLLSIPLAMIEEHQPEAPEVTQGRIETGERGLHAVGAGRIDAPESVALHPGRLPNLVRQIIGERFAGDVAYDPSECLSIRSLVGEFCAWR